MPKTYDNEEWGEQCASGSERVNQKRALFIMQFKKKHRTIDIGNKPWDCVLFSQKRRQSIDRKQLLLNIPKC